jgi:hypothetical protein
VAGPGTSQLGVWTRRARQCRRLTLMWSRWFEYLLVLPRIRLFSPVALLPSSLPTTPNRSFSSSPLLAAIRRLPVGSINRRHRQLTETDDGGGDRFQGKGSRGKLRPGRSEFYGRGAADVSGTRRGGSTGAGLRAGATGDVRRGAWILARISASAACRLVISRFTWS